jgi:NitT/TauT family transport system ATP-binding protein
MGWRPAVSLQEKGIAMSEHTPAPNKTAPVEGAAGPAVEAAGIGPQSASHPPHTHAAANSVHESGPENKAQDLKPQVSSPESPAPETKPPERPHVVVFKNVCKTFGNGSGAKVALHDISFTVEDLPNIGELVTIVGPSGCGKSTLLRIIAGLKPHFPPTSGEVHVFGKSVEEPGPDRGLVDQKYSLLPHLTVLENVAFGLKLRGVSRSERLDQAREWITKVGLDECERKYPSELSGGMQQRVAIAATLILQPRILLMDEPFGALDPGIRLRMQELLIQLWNEKEETVFLVTHSVEEAVYLGDRVFLMASKPGRLVEVLKVPRPSEPPEESRRKPWFIDFCQALLRRLEEESPAPPGVKV